MSERAVKRQAELDDLIGELAEDYAQRLRNGEKPDIEEYAARHPDAADAIRQILPALEIMGAVPGEERGDNGEQSFGSEQNKALGDFEIVREIGRGGMGVVYEARQLSLSRRVALKVLPFAAVLDERQIQRFRNEALAAAQLDHPHIVDVYGVGCERSVHFYAMRYVEGDTLADVIAELRTVRHSGANDQEKGGRGWSDQREGSHGDSQSDDDRGFLRSAPSSPGRPPRSAPSSTAALAALSTHRSATGREFFRSIARIGVEVAEALDHAHQQGVIHRDIKPANVIIDATGKSWVTDFGLARMESGATLTMTGDLLGTLRYMSPEQALAKRIVVDHRTDVYSLGITLYELITLQPAYPDEDRQELLRKIAFEDPKLPRKLNRAVPEELETIILKAIARNPNDRYETAQEFADDLQRFLDDKPIRAKRPGPVQIAAQWMRRNSALVATVLLVLLLTTIGATAAAVLISREQSNTEAARQRAQGNFDESERQKQRAESNVDLALEALDEIYLRLADERFTADRELQDADREFLEKAVAFYAQFAEQKQDDPVARAGVAAAYQKIGRIYERLSLHDQARQAFENAIGRYEPLLSELPDDRDLRLQYAEVLANHAGSLKSTGEYQESLFAYRQAIGIYEPEYTEHPEDHRTQRDLAWCYAHCGDALSRLDRYQEAVTSLETAIDLYRDLTDNHPEDSWYRRELATHLRMLGDVLSSELDDEAAQQLYVESSSEFDMLAEQVGDDPSERYYLAGNLNIEARRFGYAPPPEELEAAIGVNRERVAQWRALVDGAPANLHYRQELASALEGCSVKLTHAGRHEEAVVLLDEADAILLQLREFWPDETHTRWIQGMVWMRRGDLEKREERLDGAETAFLSAIDEFVAAEHPSDLSSGLYHLADLLHERGDFARALDSFQRVIDLEVQHPELAGNRHYQNRLRNSRTRHAAHLYRQGRKDEGERYWRQMLDGLPNAVVRYRLRIDEPGSYRLFVRTTADWERGRYLFVRIRELADGPGGDIADWYYMWPPIFEGDFAAGPTSFGSATARFEGTHWSAQPVEPMHWNVPEAGEYTVEFLGAVHGTALDRFVLQRSGVEGRPLQEQLTESPRTADGLFLSSEGRFVVDAVHFDDRHAHRQSGKQWLIVPSEAPEGPVFANSVSGRFLRLLPNKGEGGGSPLFVEFATDEERAAGILARTDRFISEFPHDVDWRLARAGAFENQERLDDALAEYSAAVQLLKERVAETDTSVSTGMFCERRLSDALFRRGQLHRRLGDDLSGSGDLKQALELDPDNASLLASIGQFVHHSVDPRVRDRSFSLECLQRAVELEPDNSYFLASLGRFTWDRHKDRETALEHIDRAIELNPTNLSAYVHREYVNRREFPELALVDLERALQMRPDYGYALRHRANIRHRLGEFEQALEDYDRVETLVDGQNLYLNHLERARLYNDMEEYESALADLNSALSLRPDSDSALKTRAETHLHLEQYDEAFGDFESYLELHEFSAAACSNASLSMALHADVPRDVALQTLEWARKAVELEAENYFFQTTLGTIAYRAGLWEESIDALHTASALKQGRRLARDAFILAMAEHQLGRVEPAELWYRAGLVWMNEHEPDDTRLNGFCDEAAQLLFGAKERPDLDPEASGDVDAFTLAIEAAPDRGWPYAGRARAHFDAGRLGKVVEDCTLALERNPTLESTWNIRGICHGRLGKPEQALEDYTTAIELKPDSYVVIANRGSLHLKQERWAEAISDFERSLELEPDYTPALEGQARAFASTEEYARAIETWTRLIELDPDDADHLLTRARFHRLAGNVEQARFDEEMYLARFQSAVDENAGDAAAVNQRGVAHFNLELFEEAIADFTTAMELDAENLTFVGNRGNAYVSLEKWSEAATDFEQVITDESGFRPWYELGLLQAHLGMTDGYRDTCRKMIKRFARADDVTSRQFAVWTSVLLPEALDEFPAAVELAEALANENPEDHALRQSLGAILFRAGRSDEALEALNEAERIWETSRADAGTTSPAYRWYLLAIVHGHLEHATEARNWLSRANERAEQELNDAENPVLWFRKLTLELLHEEAEGMVAELAAGETD